MTVFFPVIAAVLYGMSFALIERAMHSINVATYMFWGSVVGLVTVAGLWMFKGEKVSLTFTAQDSWSVPIVFGAVVAPAVGWVLSIYAIKNISPAYAAFAEISYPLFTILFLFLFFGVKNFDWHIVLGGLMVLIGSFVLVLGQMSK